MDRNAAVMENKQSDLVQTSTAFVKMLRDYQLYAERVLGSPAHVAAVPNQWNTPCAGWIKANFDAYMGGDCTRGLGIVFRDHNGALLLAAVKRIHSNMGVEETELAAACYAMEIAQRMDYDQILLEGDAQAVINKINRRDYGLAPIYALYEHMYDLCSSFVGFSCTAVRRGGNTVAHTIARWDTGMAHERICMEPFPSGLRALANLDLI